MTIFVSVNPVATVPSDPDPVHNPIENPPLVLTDNLVKLIDKDYHLVG